MTAIYNTESSNQNIPSSTSSNRTEATTQSNGNLPPNNQFSETLPANPSVSINWKERVIGELKLILKDATAVDKSDLTALFLGALAGGIGAWEAGEEMATIMHDAALAGGVIGGLSQLIPCLVETIKEGGELPDEKEARESALRVSGEIADQVEVIAGSISNERTANGIQHIARRGREKARILLGEVPQKTPLLLENTQGNDAATQGNETAIFPQENMRSSGRFSSTRKQKPVILVTTTTKYVVHALTAVTMTAIGAIPGAGVASVAAAAGGAAAVAIGAGPIAAAGAAIVTGAAVSLAAKATYRVAAGLFSRHI